MFKKIKNFIDETNAYKGPTGPKTNEELIEIQNKLRAESKQCQREAIIGLPLVFLVWGVFVASMFYWG